MSFTPRESAVAAAGAVIGVAFGVWAASRASEGTMEKAEVPVTRVDDAVDFSIAKMPKVPTPLFLPLRRQSNFK